MKAFYFLIALILAAACLAAPAGCGTEADCVAAVARAESELGALGEARSVFDSARVYAAQARLLTAIAEWDAFRVREISLALQQRDAAMRDTASGDGTLSVLLAGRQRMTLLLEEGGQRPGGRHAAELLAGVEELKAAGDEVEAAIQDIRETALARKQSLEGPEIKRQELVFRKLGHERRGAVLGDLAAIYENRARRIQLAAERGSAVDSIDHAAKVLVPALHVPELRGVGDLTDKEGRKVEKQAARMLAKRRQ